MAASEHRAIDSRGNRPHHSDADGAPSEQNRRAVNDRQARPMIGFAAVMLALAGYIAVVVNLAIQATG